MFTYWAAASAGDRGPGDDTFWKTDHAGKNERIGRPRVIPHIKSSPKNTYLLLEIGSCILIFSVMAV